jgi:hypothetical protein
VAAAAGFSIPHSDTVMLWFMTFLGLFSFLATGYWLPTGFSFITFSSVLNHCILDTLLSISRPISGFPSLTWAFLFFVGVVTVF